jgi:hypothetical protein
MGENGSQSAVKNNNLNNASAAKDSTNLAKTAENESSILESLAISTQRKKANAMIMQTRQFIPSSFANCVNCGAIVFRENNSAAIKPRQFCFRVEVIPSQMICTFFEMQSN